MDMATLENEDSGDRSVQPASPDEQQSDKKDIKGARLQIMPIPNAEACLCWLVMPFPCRTTLGRACSGLAVTKLLALCRQHRGEQAVKGT